ncbi:hypothetical protein [Nakamurella leprariae]|uniref:Response regulatory domain-containing protein n=1 Tax=Nakamurella leprariae TaxID=2803911 RepID=A0A938YEZ1_9ACTN|nr:hypothetical protein [Nakamurella leprariae]MBM9466934.1 hypothetical protein [Nakamurella leprariae]
MTGADDAGHRRVLVYSHRAEVREQIMNAIGSRPAPDVGTIRYQEAAGVADVLVAVDGREVDLLVLDAEAQPTGGIGISRQLHLETGRHGGAMPPVVLVVRRAADRWLATWAGADAVVMHPLDPVTAAQTVAETLRRVAAGTPAPEPAL